ncbi:MAG: geranylgeranyl reductase family protein [Nitrososphaerales archaeon]
MDGLIADFDVIVAGGGLSGLLAAKEIASSKLSVAIMEENLEIGIPEKCAGLISVKALTSLGLFPSRRIVKNEIKRALIVSPLGSKAEIDATKQRVIALNRREFDRELASMAEREGAIIELGQRVTSVEDHEEFVKIRTAKQERKAKILVDARGLSSLNQEQKAGILQSAQYDIHGEWFEKDRVEVYPDNNVTPGFPTWVIPLDDDTARLGVAGYGINPVAHLDKFVENHGARIIKKSVSPIFIGGASKSFVQGNIVAVGDAAGQTKPTTGGGIFTGGIGAILAGRAISKYLLSNDPLALRDYEVEWRRAFGREFMIMSQARRVYERVDNKTMDKMIRVLASPKILDKISNESDFDYHSIGISQTLSMIKEHPLLALDLIKIGANVILDLLK